MARARNIKPGFFKNEQLAELSPQTRLLFIGLWTLADKEGRLEYRPKRIKAELFPYEDVDIEANIKALCASMFLRRFKHAASTGDVCVIQVVNWLRHQHPHHKETPSEWPDEKNAISPIELRELEASLSDEWVEDDPSSPGQTESNPSDSLNPLTDSLNPQTRTPVLSEAETPPPTLDRGAWSRFTDYRKQIRKPIKPVSVLAAQRKLAGFGADQNAVVEQSIANGWTGLFELKAPINGGFHGKPERNSPAQRAADAAEERARQRAGRAGGNSGGVP